MTTLYFFFSFSLVFLFSSFGVVVGEMQTKPPQRELRKETATIQLSCGNLELGFYKDEARNTADHVLKAFKLGLYETNHVFRVDANFFRANRGLHDESKSWFDFAAERTRKEENTRRARRANHQTQERDAFDGTVQRSRQRDDVVFDFITRRTAFRRAILPIWGVD